MCFLSNLLPFKIGLKLDWELEHLAEDFIDVLWSFFVPGISLLTYFDFKTGSGIFILILSTSFLIPCTTLPEVLR